MKINRQAMEKVMTLRYGKYAWDQGDVSFWLDEVVKKSIVPIKKSNFAAHEIKHQYLQILKQMEYNEALENILDET